MRLGKVKKLNRGHTVGVDGTGNANPGQAGLFFIILPLSSGSCDSPTQFHLPPFM